MRRRSTYIHSANQPFDPEEIQLKKQQLLHSGIKAAHEEKLTFNFDELPAQLLDVLRLSKRLHIRWSPETSPGSIAPFTSRLPPGLHVLYTPLERKDNELLCPLLRKAFSNELECHKPSLFFPQLHTSESPATLQYYSTLPSLSQFAAYIQRYICSQSNQRCFHDAALLNIVDYLDLDYDSASNSLSLSAFWSKAPPAIYDPMGERVNLDQWPLDISSQENNRVEVGILSSIPPVDPQDIQLGGFLTVIGEDEKPKAVQFSFPSRHHILLSAEAAKQAYTASFQEPQGLHPTLEISFASTASLSPPSNKPDGAVCTLNAYMTLPSSIFADSYAFTAKDPLFEQSHNLNSLLAIFGELDLEAPDYIADRWGSTMLLELATPDNESKTPIPDAPWKVTVPLHLRYQPPAEGGFHEIQLPWPVVFWACSADEETDFTGNPFDRTYLGYEEGFHANTLFYHLKPEPRAGSGSRLIETIKVPVLDTSKVGGDAIIEQATLVVILFGFAWVLFKLWPGLSQQISGNKTPAANKGGEKKNK